ncbi:hypothetical protein Ddye_005724 [Dipteronia dyeriana]|uniref:RNase H type-1 domain-containing protein n=1 Tax=Dipteronia dyeriana TaxID=168575 RepID=A0AAD9XGL9_9ROSI|nr:hypothetical protein Ddye_005724 [Dipteronia dyeriana]
MRNWWVHGERVQMMDMVLAWSKSFLLDFQETNETVVCSDRIVTCGSEVVHWVPPIGDLYKINTYATLNVNENIVGMGDVIRNQHGGVMGSTVQCLEACFSPALGEAVDLLRGIEFAVDLGTLPVVIESKAWGVVELINSGSMNFTEIGLVCSDIVSRLRNGLITRVFYVPRNANTVAHSLAKLAITVDNDRFWVVSFPDCVRHCIQDDLPGCFSQ